MSPYLFLLCAESLGALINQVHQDGISIARKAPLISHLFFADENLVFARANVREAKSILEILKVYENLSGQWSILINVRCLLAKASNKILFSE